MMAARPPPLWIADQVRNDVTTRYMGCAPLCGYCLKASMTAGVTGMMEPASFLLDCGSSPQCPQCTVWDRVGLSNWLVVFGLMMPSVLMLCEVRLFHLLIRSTSRASCLEAGQ